MRYVRSLVIAAAAALLLTACGTQTNDPQQRPGIWDASRWDIANWE